MFGPPDLPGRRDQALLKSGTRRPRRGSWERLHKTMRAEFFRAADSQHATLAELQAALDAWVADWGTTGRTSHGGRPPIEGTSQAGTRRPSTADPVSRPAAPGCGDAACGSVAVGERARQDSLGGFTYAVGARPASRSRNRRARWTSSRGVVVVTHAQRLRSDQADRVPRRMRVARRARDATAGLVRVPRLASGARWSASPGTGTPAGRSWARQPIDVTIVAHGSVQLSKDGKVIPGSPEGHDRSRELGAFADPKGRPRRKNSTASSCHLATGTHLSPGYPNLTDPAPAKIKIM